jgi:hypothetical protein
LEFEEEEVDVCETEIVVNTLQLHNSPLPAMEHIPTSIIDRAIDLAVKKLAKKSPAGFRKSLREGLKAGDPSWIETVFEFVKQIEATSEAPWVLEKRLKRKAGAEMQSAMERAGFHNPGEMYAAISAARGKGIQDDF